MSIVFKSSPLTNNLTLTSLFGIRGGKPHNGVDIRAIVDTPVRAVADGTAIVRQQLQNGNPAVGEGWGLYVEITHNNGAWITRYAHLTSSRLVLNTPHEVKAGAEIGRSGGDPSDQPGAGNARDPHLHFELLQRQGANYISLNPEGYLYNIDNVNVVISPNVSSRGGTYLNLSGFPSISPYIASLDSFHPNIQYELTKRAYASQTATAYMPFVKLTSLSKVLNKHLEPSAVGTNNDVYCPTLGPHGNANISFEDMYSPRSGRSVVGYATALENGIFIQKPVVVETTADETDAPNIPMPGIVSMTTERTTSGAMGIRGGLFKANIKIMAHSVGQLNALLVYFLRPATRVILEFGKQSSNQTEEITPFNWNRSLTDIQAELKDLVTAKKDQKEFINTYVYGNNGNYDIFIGYVVNFKSTYTGKNTYEVDLTVHSIQQFEVPIKLTGAQSLCKTSAGYLDTCKVSDISAYFNPESADANSFAELLKNTKNATDTSNPDLKAYKSHVIQLEGGSTSTPAEHLISWRFFTDIVMNHKLRGIPSVFSTLEGVDADTRMLLHTSVLSPYVAEYLELKDDQLTNSQVSWHKELRSTNPNTMLIYNTKAQGQVKIQELSDILKVARVDTNTEDETLFNAIAARGSFDNLSKTEESSGIGSLYQGVWLNTAAIKRAFESTDTLTVALNKLLMEMNAAVEGYWNLQLLSNDTGNPGIHVVDMGLSKQVKKDVRPDTPTPTEIQPSDFGSGDVPAYLYQFNRKLKRFATDDIGSELLDIKLEASLPQVIAIQAIAGVGGVAQQGTWEAIGIDELKSITLFDVYPNCGEREKEEANSPSGTCNSATTEAQRKKLAEQVEGDNTLAGQAVGLVTGGLVELARGTGPAQRRRDLAELTRRTNALLTSTAKNYGKSFGKAIFMIEYDKTRMMRLLTANPNANKVHPFNSSNLTKTVVDLTMPGIGGLQLFQSFTVARVPNIIDRGFYIVTKVNHEFSTERGWITKVQGRFRYAPSSLEGSSPRTGARDENASPTEAGSSAERVTEPQAPVPRVPPVPADTAPTNPLPTEPPPRSSPSARTFGALPFGSLPVTNGSNLLSNTVKFTVPGLSRDMSGIPAISPR
jgi:hypothetical protein